MGTRTVLFLPRGPARASQGWKLGCQGPDCPGNAFCASPHSTGQVGCLCHGRCPHRTSGCPEAGTTGPLLRLGMRLGELPFPRSQLGGGEAGTGSPAALMADAGADAGADTGAETAQTSPLRAARHSAQVSGLPPSGQEPGSALPAPHGTHSRNQKSCPRCGFTAYCFRASKTGARANDRCARTPGRPSETDPGGLGRVRPGGTRWCCLPRPVVRSRGGAGHRLTLSPALPLAAE